MSLSDDLLKDIQLFHGVDTASIAGLLQTCPILELKKDQLLIKPEEQRNCMFIILKGKVSVHLESVSSDPVNVLSAGDSVGELSLIDERPRSAFVVAMEPVQVLQINRSIFWSLANSSPGVAVNLLIILSARLRGNNEAVVESLKEQEKYRISALVDGLTGLHNRRWLDDILPRQMSRATMSDEELAIAMIDVDHFKNFNDTYGHQAGDFVLSSVARCLSSRLRPTDLSARYGGEEFMVIFPRTGLDYALGAARRLCEAVSELELTTLTGLDLPKITISIGVAELKPQETMVSFVEAADGALYVAKETGRNRVCEAKR